MELQNILKAYELDGHQYIITPLGNGLINRTWTVSEINAKENYVLQKLNTSVFKRPNDIAANIRHIAAYLAHHNPEYLFIAPLKTAGAEEMYFDGDSGYYRLFPFLEDSKTVDVVSSAEQAYEASKQFALFTRQLSGFDTRVLNTTLDDFHNLTLRFNQYRQALEKGNPERIKEATTLIEFLNNQVDIIGKYEAIRHHPGFSLRVTHHDTKISNVLFNKENKGLCVIDLDTVMPGYFISDVGDMMRTYLSPASEEEKDFKKIEIREDIFEAIVQGYFDEMKDELSESEKSHFLYAGKFMIYMQALRFLTDHLNNDVYYGAMYEGHNFVRAQNQAVLLQKLIEKEEKLNKIIAQYI
jgi:thiamine kinase-like enzyme